MRSCLASRACLKAYLLFLTPRFDNPTLFLCPFLTSRISNYGVGVVIRSEFSGVKAGDHIYGILREFYIATTEINIIPMLRICKAFQNYFIKDNLDYLKVLENPYNLPWSTFIGVLGMPGKSSEYY